MNMIFSDEWYNKSLEIMKATNGGKISGAEKGEFLFYGLFGFSSVGKGRRINWQVTQKQINSIRRARTGIKNNFLEEEERVLIFKA